MMNKNANTAKVPPDGSHAASHIVSYTHTQGNAPSADTADTVFSEDLANTAASVSMADTIYHYLWTQIAYLQLLPGVKLSEAGLAREFGCSRIPVREAVQRLVKEGALRVEPQRGSFVTHIDLEALERTRYIREVLETRIVLDDFDKGLLFSIPVISLLKSLVDRQEDLIKVNDYEEVFHLDTEFHRTFYTIDQKEFVLPYTGGNDINYLRARLLTLKSEPKDIMIRQHREIIYNIDQKNREGLRQALICHYANVTSIKGYQQWIPGQEASEYFI